MCMHGGCVLMCLCICVFVYICKLIHLSVCVERVCECVCAGICRCVEVCIVLIKLERLPQLYHECYAFL